MPTREEVNGAIIIYSYAAQMYPDCADAFFRRGVLYSLITGIDRKGPIDPKGTYIINDINKAIELNSKYRNDKQYYMALYSGHLCNRDHAKALSIMHEWVRNLPDDWLPYILLSVEYAKRCDYVLAERYASLAEQHGNPDLANINRMSFNHLCTEVHVP